MESLCVAVFLLSTSNPYVTDRMVLAKLSPDYSYVYREISKAIQFPMDKPSSDVYMIKSETQKPGTSYAVYCSHKLDNQSLMNGLLTQIEPFTIGGPSKDWNRINPENPCLVKLSSMAKERNYDIILTSEIVKDDSCSGRNLMELALHKYVIIHKISSFYLEESPQNRIRVYFDVGIEIRLDEQQAYFEGKKVLRKTEDEILLWYIGYLHIFRRGIKDRKWYAYTSLSSINFNGYQIHQFIWRNSPPFRNFIRSLASLQTLAEKRTHYPDLSPKDRFIEIDRKTSYESLEKLKLDSLQPSNSHGILYSFKWYGDRASGNFGP